MKKTKTLRLLRAILSVVLVSVLMCGSFSMTAVAAMNPNIVICGLTLVSPPDKLYYNDGDELDLDGMKLEVTYMATKEIEMVGYDNATRLTDIFEYNMDSINKLTVYGIDCNFFDGQTLDMDDNLKQIILRYGEYGSSVFETGVFLSVRPTSLWRTRGEEVNGFNDGFSSSSLLDNGDGNYLIAADGQYLLTSFCADFEPDGMPYRTMKTVEVNVNGDTIPRLDDVFNSEIGSDNIIWSIDDGVQLDNDGNYIITWESLSGLYLCGDILEMIRETDKPLGITSASDLGEVYLTDTTGGMMFFVVEDETNKVYDPVTGNYFYGGTQEYFYVAVSSDGYAYLTTDRVKAAQISVYRIEDKYPDGLEIAWMPDRMDYVEGEAFNPAGMTVNLMFNDSIAYTIPSEQFEFYGIMTVPHDGEMMTVKEHNYANICVYLPRSSENTEELFDYGDTTLSVKENPIPDSGFEVKTGELVDGNYLITWFDESYNDIVDNNNYYDGYALSSYLHETVRGDYGSSTYKTSSLSSADVRIFNGEIVESNIGKSEIWTVKYDAGKRAYTIQLAHTGEYLTREKLTGDDFWACGADVDTEIMANIARLTLSEEVSSDAYWLIDGAFDAAIVAAGDASEGEEKYIAPVDDRAFAVLDLSLTDGQYAENFFFVSVPDGIIEATGIEFPYQQLTLPVGEQAVLDVTVSPVGCTDAVNWNSSDKSVATVIDGVVTAVGPGTSTITASVNDGKVTAECEIVVCEPEPGDITGDGKINLMDSTVLRRWLAGWEGVTIDEASADVTGDGKVTMMDSTVLRRYLAGWEGVELQ